MAPDRQGRHQGSGVHITGGAHNSVIAAGYRAQAQGSYGASPSAALPPAQEELLQAMAELRVELAELRSEMDERAVRCAELALDEAESEAAKAQPERDVLHFRIQSLATALGHVKALASGVSAVRDAFDSFVSS
ncbi:hypothetical protein GCM10020221_10550 [Streptomyces thioluteus]|uniref:Uncharacterized protein n=1 Tax=Streptomyces thioluteus TaxID=66431 RepID=A0ABN3WKY0_STRTU